MKGKVYLAGTGPGDPDLLTLRALRALRQADVVLHDALVSSQILGLIPSRVMVLNVGERGGSLEFAIPLRRLVVRGSNKKLKRSQPPKKSVPSK